MAGNHTTIVVTVTDYTTVYPSTHSALTNSESLSTTTQHTSLGKTSRVSTVTNLESFPIVAAPTSDVITRQISSTKPTHSTLQTSIRNSVTQSSGSSSSLLITSSSQSSSRSTISRVTALPTGWPRPNTIPDDMAEKKPNNTVPILMLLFLVFSALFFLGALIYFVYRMFGKPCKGCRRKDAEIAQLKRRLGAAESVAPRTMQVHEEMPIQNHDQSRHAAPAILEQGFLHPREGATPPRVEVTPPDQASRGVRILTPTRPRTDQSPYDQAFEPFSNDNDNVYRVSIPGSSLEPASEATYTPYVSTVSQGSADSNVATAATDLTGLAGITAPTSPTGSTVSIVSTCTIASMEPIVQINSIASTGSTASHERRQLSVEENRAQSLVYLENGHPEVNEEELDADFEKWRWPFWKRTLGNALISNYGRPPGVKLDKTTNFAGKPKVPPSLRTAENPGPAPPPPTMQSPSRLKGHMEDDSGGEFITIALDSPMSGSSIGGTSERMRLAEERLERKKKWADGNGVFENFGPAPVSEFSAGKKSEETRFAEEKLERKKKWADGNEVFESFRRAPISKSSAREKSEETKRAEERLERKKRWAEGNGAFENFSPMSKSNGRKKPDESRLAEERLERKKKWAEGNGVFERFSPVVPHDMGGESRNRYQAYVEFDEPETRI